MTSTMVRSAFPRLRTAVQDELLRRIPEHLERRQWNREQIAAFQGARLRRLLSHAIGESPFHRRRLAGFDPERFVLSELPRLPVMTKAQMMEALDDVFTDRRLTRAAVDNAVADAGSQPQPIFGEYTALVSGGTSGHRGLFVLDRDAWVGFILSVTRSLIARMAASGGPPPGGLSIAMVCAPSAVHATGSASAWTTAGAFPIHYVAVPVTLPIEQIVERLNTLQPRALCGYPSVLARLVAEQDAGRLHISPASVTTTSETLVVELRREIADGFGAPIVDVFGSSEGLVGTTAPDDDVFVFNSDMCVVELVDADGTPVPAGVPASKVLVTNLYNHVQPLIRYELGDRFVQRGEAAEDGHLRATVRGRPGSVLRYTHIDVHPMAIEDVMERSAGILDYQVWQTPRGIDVNLLAVAAVDTDGLVGELTKALSAAGLHDAAVSVHIVDSLERTRDSGKIQRFVPLGGAL